MRTRARVGRQSCARVNAQWWGTRGRREWRDRRPPQRRLPPPRRPIPGRPFPSTATATARARAHRQVPRSAQHSVRGAYPSQIPHSSHMGGGQRGAHRAGRRRLDAPHFSRGPADRRWGWARGRRNPKADAVWHSSLGHASGMLTPHAHMSAQVWGRYRDARAPKTEWGGVVWRVCVSVMRWWHAWRVLARHAG